MTIHKNTFIYILLLLILFIPSSKWFGGIQTSIMLIFLFLLFHLSLNIKKIKLNLFFISLFSLSFLPLVISINLNYEHLSLNDSFEFIRIIIYLLLFNFSYNLASNVDFKKILLIIKIFIVFELTFVIIQRLELITFINYLQLVWDGDKNWLYRNTGSFNNPNVLAFFSILSYIILIKYESSKIKKTIFTIFIITIIIFSASRTGIICFLLIFILINLNMKGLKDLIKLFFVIIVSFLLLISFYDYLLESNKYLFQIVDIFATGDLSRVKTMNDRFEHWQSTLNILNDKNYIYGMGPGKTIGLKYLDNEYLATFTKYGYIGVLIYMIIYLTTLIITFNFKDSRDKSLIRYYILILMIFGLTSETFSSWYLMLPFYIFIGIILSNNISLKRINNKTKCLNFNS